MELSPVQRRIRDFYFKEGLGAPPAVSHVHRPGLVPEQSLFSLEDLRRHLNNPLLDLNYLNLFQAGKPVDLTDARLFKLVQRRKIEFADHHVLQQHLKQGAACVLEGIDILEPEINMLAASLDRAHVATFSNATVFFSQRGNEAYRGNLDTNDVLVVHLEGEKRWWIHQRQAPRRINLTDLTDVQMGPVEAEVVMRPGDVLFLRSFTPHRVQTLSSHSLHMSFDPCDRQPSIEHALQLLLAHYDKNSSPRLTPLREDLDNLFRLSRSGAYEDDLSRLLASEKPDMRSFAACSQPIESRISIGSSMLQSRRAPKGGSLRQPVRANRNRIRASVGSAGGRRCPRPGYDCQAAANRTHRCIAATWRASASARKRDGKQAEQPVAARNRRLTRTGDPTTISYAYER